MSDLCLKFRRIDDMTNSDCDVEFHTAMAPQAPEPGETVNVEGYPYTVHERAWAYGDFPYCYLRVLPLFRPEHGETDALEE